MYIPLQNKQHIIISAIFCSSYVNKILFKMNILTQFLIIGIATCLYVYSANLWAETYAKVEMHKINLEHEEHIHETEMQYKYEAYETSLNYIQEVCRKTAMVEDKGWFSTTIRMDMGHYERCIAANKPSNPLQIENKKQNRIY